MPNYLLLSDLGDRDATKIHIAAVHLLVPWSRSRGIEYSDCNERICRPGKLRIPVCRHGRFGPTPIGIRTTLVCGAKLAARAVRLTQLRDSESRSFPC